MRIRIGFNGVLLLALAAGAFISWYAVPTAYDQTSSSEKLQQAASLMVDAAAAQATTSAQPPQPSQTQQRKGLTGQALSQEAIAISKLLRDPASANYTLFDSESAIAGELKASIYEQLRAGRTREEIFDFMVERYGEMIRYEPDFNSGTALLWAAPWLAVAAACFFLWRRMRVRRAPARGNNQNSNKTTGESK